MCGRLNGSMKPKNSFNLNLNLNFIIFLFRIIVHLNAIGASI